MSLEAQDSPTTRTTCRILILLFIVISVQAIEGTMEGNPNLQHLLSSGIWPPKAGQHLAVQFYDGTKVCEVPEISTSGEMV